MSASRHISSGRSTVNTTKITSRKSESPIKPQKARNNSSLSTTRRAAAERVHRNNGAGIGNGFQAKSSPPDTAQRAASNSRIHSNSSQSQGAMRKSSPMQRRPSPAASPSSSANKRGRQRPDANNDIVFTNKDGDSKTDDIDTGGGDDAASHQPPGKIITREILEKSLESDIFKVYDIDLHGANIESIKNLDQFINLRVLDLSCNRIRNIENLANNKDLRELKLYDNRITAIANLERLQELCSLQLQHNKIRTIGKGLAIARKLKTLRLDSNCIGKIESRELAACSQLTYLDISTNKLDSLSALNTLSSLEELRATHNCLRAVTDLKRCRKLQEIDISNNKLADISGLKSLHNLTVLRISHNQLTTDQLKAVDKLRSLHTLDVSHNRLAEVECVATQFPVLEVLNISSNKITSWSSVVSLHRCECLSELFVHGNPFSQPNGEKPSYHQELQATLLTIDILDGALVKRSSTNKGAPIMRPMSASTVVSARQVENQLRNTHEELTSFMTSLTNRFANVRTMLETLPSEPPKQRPFSAMSDDLSIRSVSSMSNGRPASRCNSRNRIADAQAFASQHF